jgi:hypothetical protein
VIGQYTGFNDTTTFDFGSGVTVGPVNVLGPTIAQVGITIALNALQGFRSVTATTDGVTVGGTGFSVTPSQAIVVSVSPNTAHQQDTLTVQVVGQNTNGMQAPLPSFGGGSTSRTRSSATPRTLR